MHAVIPCLIRLGDMKRFTHYMEIIIEYRNLKCRSVRVREIASSLTQTFLQGVIRYGNKNQKAERRFVLPFGLSNFSGFSAKTYFMIFFYC